MSKLRQLHGKSASSLFSPRNEKLEDLRRGAQQSHCHAGGRAQRETAPAPRTGLREVYLSRCSSVERLCFLVFFRSTWFRLWSLDFSSEPCSTLRVDPLCQGGRDPIQERTGGVLKAACSLQVRSDHEKQLEQVSVLCNQENSVNASTRTHTHYTCTHTPCMYTRIHMCAHMDTHTQVLWGR